VNDAIKWLPKVQQAYRVMPVVSCIGDSHPYLENYTFPTDNSNVPGAGAQSAALPMPSAVVPAVSQPPAAVSAISAIPSVAVSSLVSPVLSSFSAVPSVPAAAFTSSSSTTSWVQGHSNMLIIGGGVAGGVIAIAGIAFMLVKRSKRRQAEQEVYRLADDASMVGYVDNGRVIQQPSSAYKMTTRNDFSPTQRNEQAGYANSASGGYPHDGGYNDRSHDKYQVDSPQYF